MKFFKLHWPKKETKTVEGTPIRVQVYPLDKDRSKPAEERLIADNISPPILSDGDIVPGSLLPAHEKIVRPEGHTPIYTERRIDEDTKNGEEEEKTQSSKKNTTNE